MHLITLFCIRVALATIVILVIYKMSCIPYPADKRIFNRNEVGNVIFVTILLEFLIMRYVSIYCVIHILLILLLFREDLECVVAVHVVNKHTLAKDCVQMISVANLTML